MNVLAWSILRKIKTNAFSFPGSTMPSVRTLESRKRSDHQAVSGIAFPADKNWIVDESTEGLRGEQQTYQRR
jgi:hypothetical protein